jgi:hypothetical protein
MCRPIFRLFKLIASVFSGAAQSDPGPGQSKGQLAPGQHRVIAGAEPAGHGVVVDSVLDSGGPLERLKPYLKPPTLEEVRRIRLAAELEPDEPGFAPADQDFLDSVAELDVLRSRCTERRSESPDVGDGRASDRNHEQAERPSAVPGTSQSDGALPARLICGASGPLAVSRIEAVQALMRERVERGVVERPDVRVDRNESN